MSTDAISLQLFAEPRNFSVAGRDEFEVGIVATNWGAEVVDPELHRARLLINGRDSLIWADAIANGLRQPEWSALPPGGTVSMSWPSMGEAFFPEPGVYALQLRVGHIEAPPVAIRVSP